MNLLPTRPDEQTQTSLTICADGMTTMSSFATAPTDLAPLRDGRSLEVADYGDPKGLPTLFFHGFIGSHYQAAAAHNAALCHGVRLVAVHRAGVGRSSPLRRNVIADVIPDIEDLTHHLGIDRFAVFGISGGAPYALACLARLPQRVRGAVIVSGLGPVECPQALEAMRPDARLALRGGRYFPLAARLALELKVRQFRRDPEAFLDGVISRWSRSDQELFQRREFRAMFLGDLRETLGNGHGPRSLAHELGLYFRWGFRLAEIGPEQRILFWHGRADLLVPPAVCQFVAAQLPWAEVTLQPGGHFMILERTDELMRRAVEMLEGE
jgi:pimeloyl-ACP methyl ester carboxylesterase